MPLSKQAIRAIAIRNAIKRRSDNDNMTNASNDNGRKVAGRRMSAEELNMCLQAAGFEMHA